MEGTLSMSDLVKHCDNIYEAIIIISKRAGQINEEQKIFIEREAGIDDSLKNYDDEEFIDREMIDEDKIIKLPKPTELAIKEFIEGNLHYDYGDDVEGEQSEK